MRNVAIVTHKYLPQPDDDLVYYLNKNRGYDIYHIKHNFPDAKDRQSVLDIYLHGKKIRELKTLDYIFLPEILIFLKELFFTIKWILLSNKKYDLYIGMDGLCTFFGLILRRLGFAKKVIYWSIDFVPFNRFNSRWKNFFYHKINTLACKNADEVWDLSPRMAGGRKKYLDINKNDYKLYKVVPYGVWTSRIKIISYSQCEKHTLVFMGHLMSKQGVDLVIKKIAKIVKKIPDFKFKIIGGGDYKEDLINLTRKLSVNEYCQFLGRLDSVRLEEEIARSAVAIAPYLKSKHSYTYYADPGKIKTYLACGVPVLLTDLPWNAKEVQQKRCGLIIKDGGSDLIEKLSKMMKPSINKEFRKNTIEYSRDYDYKKIFSKLEL